MPARQTIATPQDYLASLSPDRREAIGKVRAVILKNLPKGYEERIQYGMLTYVVPHSIYPEGYHCKPEDPLPYLSLGSAKSHMAVYAMCVYGDPATNAWFRKAYADSGKRLDMGKSCIRFKKVEDLPLDVIGQLVARVPVKKYVAHVQEILNESPKERNARRAAAA